MYQQLQCPLYRELYRIRVVLVEIVSIKWKRTRLRKGRRGSAFFRRREVLSYGFRHAIFSAKRSSWIPAAWRFRVLRSGFCNFPARQPQTLTTAGKDFERSLSFQKKSSSGVLVESLRGSKELNGIEYTDAGLEELERHMPGSVAAAEDVVEHHGNLVTVEVTRLLRNNAKRMLADHDGCPVVVQVRSTANFMVGMLVEVRAGEGSLYYYKGQLPRWKGRM
jgi:hypothetical protein